MNPATAAPPPEPRFENPCAFQFTLEQYRRLGALDFFGNRRVMLLSGEVYEQYPDDPADPEPRPFRFTREQYYRIGELGFFDGRRVELIRGEIVEMSPIGWLHRLGTGLASDWLKLAFPTGFCIDVQQPFPVPGVAPGTEPQPDVAVIPGPRRGHTGHPTTAVLLVEVADTTLAYDTTTKAELYATAGVPEYWVLDLPGRQLHVYRDPQPLPAGLGAVAYRTHRTLDPTDSVSPLHAPHATVTVADLFP